MSSQRSRLFSKSAGLAFALGVAAAAYPTTASASILDAGVQVGLLQRSLSDVDYTTKFAWQLNADLAFFPLLKVGPYVTFTSATIQPGTESEASVAFRTLGARLKLTLPVSDIVQPFAVGGLGWAHAAFPDQTVSICQPPLPACVTRAVPSATANFAEFLLGGGLMVQLAPPVALTAEFNWRPTTGYKNDVYEQQVQARSTTAPDPSRNGVAWVGLVGLALTL